MTDTGIVDANHALLCGQVFGAIYRLAALSQVVSEDNFRVRPILQGSDYTNVIEIERPSGVYRVRVEGPV